MIKTIGKLYRRKKKYILMFTGVIGVCLVWRGVWTFADAFLFPNQLELSGLFSVLSGMAILFFNDRNIEELEQKYVFQKEEIKRNGKKVEA